MIQLGNGSTGNSLANSQGSHQSGGPFANKRRWTIPQWVFKIPLKIRQFIILPLLCIIALFITVAVLKVAWKFGEYVVYAIAIGLAVVALWFTIRWARKQNYKLPLQYFTPSPFKIILLITGILIWLAWRVIATINMTLETNNPIMQMIENVIFTLLPIGAGWFAWKQLRKKYPQFVIPDLATMKKKWYWRENEFFILLGVIALHLDIYTVWPQWWIQHILMDHRTWWLHGILVAFAWLIPKGTIKYHHRLGKIGVWVAGLSMLYIFTGGPSWHIGNTASAMTTQPQQTSPFKQWPTVDPNSLVPTVASHADRQVKKMLEDTVCGDHPDLCAVAIRESGMNQCETDEKTGEPDCSHVLLGKIKDEKTGKLVTNDATGIFQIKAGLHKKFCDENHADIMTAEGNKDCALLLYNRPGKEGGLSAWIPAADNPNRNLVFDLSVKTKDWGSKIRLDYGTHVWFKCDEIVKGRQDGTKPFDAGPGIRTYMGITRDSLEFQKVSEEAVCRFVYTY